MPSLVLTGANIQLYINNKKYNTVQSVQFSVDYGETEIYGIDVPYAQEIATTKISVRGTVQGIRLKQSGGLQGSNIRPLFTEMAASPYISIRITDRYSGEDILFVPNAKITRESHSIQSKQVYRLNFDFVGSIPLFALDRST